MRIGLKPPSKDWMRAWVCWLSTLLFEETAVEKLLWVFELLFSLLLIFPFLLLSLLLLLILALLLLLFLFSLLLLILFLFSLSSSLLLLLFPLLIWSWRSLLVMLFPFPFSRPIRILKNHYFSKICRSPQNSVFLNQ